LTAPPIPAAEPEPRERILETAYELFSRFGFPTIGVDRIVAAAGVAKMTLYRHFRSKDELTVAVLDLREQVWTERWLIDGAAARAATAEDRLVAIFDLLGDWFARDDYEGCLFINSLIESHDRTSTIGEASAQKLENVRHYVEGLAREVGVADADGFSRKWELLMQGAITSAFRGDRTAAQRGRDLALLLLERERPS
jgi:AcrR family transcriptional regulator